MTLRIEFPPYFETQIKSGSMDAVIFPSEANIRELVKLGETVYCVSEDGVVFLEAIIVNIFSLEGEGVKGNSDLLTKLGITSYENFYIRSFATYDIIEWKPIQLFRIRPTNYLLRQCSEGLSDDIARTGCKNYFVCLGNCSHKYALTSSTFCFCPSCINKLAKETPELLEALVQDYKVCNRLSLESFLKEFEYKKELKLIKKQLSDYILNII